MMLDQIVQKQRVLANEIARGATREFIVRVRTVLDAVRRDHSPPPTKGVTMTLGIHLPLAMHHELDRLRTELKLKSKRDVIYAALIVGIQGLKEQGEQLR